jgi:DNA-binding XRE family transcriptional regulator
MENWKDIRKGIVGDNPAREQRIQRERARIELERKLYDLRRSKNVTQRDLAEIMDVAQENVSRIERADDLRVSTLAGYVESLGGRLEIRAVFDNDDVQLLS